MTTEFTLAFDPWNCNSEDGALTQQIFERHESRVLFCFVRRDHIVSQYFHKECLRLGSLIKYRAPQSVEALEDILRLSADPALARPWREIHYGPARKEKLQLLLECLQKKRGITLHLNQGEGVK